MALSLKSVLEARQITGVQARLQGDGAAVFAVARLRNTSKGVELIEGESQLAELDALKTVAKSGSAIALSIEGKGTVLRTVALEGTATPQALLEAVLPNARATDFYLEAHPAGENRYLVAVARKQAVDALLAALKANGYLVVDVHLGPYVVAAARPICGSNNASGCVVGNHQFALEGDQISDYAGTSADAAQAVSIDGKSLPTEALPAFAAGLLLFAPALDTRIPDVERAASGHDELKQKQLFQVGGWAVLLILLGTLLGNFFAFDHYRQHFEALDQKVALHEGNLQSIRLLEADLGSKQTLMEQTGILNPSRTSFWADRIAETVPSAIQLTTLAVHPRQRRAGDDEGELHFENGIIRIGGVARHSTYMNDWIATLEQFEWIGEVTVLNYTSDPDLGAGVFNLTVALN